MLRRRRGPGLIRTAARTAVIAGTAQAVGGKVAQRQHQQFAAQQQAAAAQQQAGSPPAPPPSNLTTTLQQLASLRDQGILTEEEFTAKKKLVLGI